MKASQQYSIFVTGRSGYLGHEVARALDERGLAYRELGRAQGIDLLDIFALDTRLDACFRQAPKPPLLLHLAAWSRQGACEREPEGAFRVNTEATALLAAAVRSAAGRMLYTSTDLVFDGESAPYGEDAEAAPLSVYGLSKLEGEAFVTAYEDGLVCRIPLLFGPSFDGARGASDALLASARAGQELRLFEDEWRTPLHVREAAERIVEAALTPGLRGIRHLPGPERMTRVELGQRLLSEAGVEATVRAVSRRSMSGAARPRDCSLRSLEA